MQIISHDQRLVFSKDRERAWTQNQCNVNPLRFMIKIEIYEFEKRKKHLLACITLYKYRKEIKIASLTLGTFAFSRLNLTIKN